MMNALRDHERTRAAVPDDPPSGLDALAHAATGTWRRGRMRIGELRTRAKAILEAARTRRGLGEGRLTAEAARLRERYRRSRRCRAGRRAVDDAAEDDALALTVEAARRHLGLEAHSEEVMAALAIRRGFLAETATGEGKTLAIALAAVLHRWTRLPCHVITANDYLARRDADSLAAYYRACSLRAAPVVGGQESEERRDAYDAEIVYTTAT